MRLVTADPSCLAWCCAGRAWSRGGVLLVQAARAAPRLAVEHGVSRAAADAADRPAAPAALVGVGAAARYAPRSSAARLAIAHAWSQPRNVLPRASLTRRPGYTSSTWT